MDRGAVRLREEEIQRAKQREILVRLNAYDSGITEESRREEAARERGLRLEIEIERAKSRLHSGF